VVTKDPVDTGVSVADHMYDEPAKLTLSAIVSDVLPIEKLLARQNGMAYDDLYEASGFSRSMSALGVLDSLRVAHEPCTYVSGLRRFDNIVVTKIHYTTDKDKSRVLEFTADLEEVIIVNTRTVLYKVPKDKKTKRQVDPPVNEGKKEAEKVEAKPEEAIPASWLDMLTGGRVTR
jgi:hypothetical protein